MPEMDEMRAYDVGPKPNVPETLSVLYKNSVEKYAKRPAVISHSQSPDHLSHSIDAAQINREHGVLYWTYEQLDSVSQKVAAGLRGHITSGSSDPIVAFLWSSVEWALAKWASVKLHVPFCPLDPGMLGKGLRDDCVNLVSSVRPQIIFVENKESTTAVLDVFGRIPDHEPACIVVLNGHIPPYEGDIQIMPFNTLIQSERLPASARLPIRNGSKDDVSQILFTSGSTGSPKVSSVCLNS